MSRDQDAGVAAEAAALAGSAPSPAVSAVPAPAANAVYAIPDRSRKAYITAGKRYPVRMEHSKGFEVTDDEGDSIYCLWTGCAHLRGGDWQRVEEPAAIAKATGQVA